MAVAIRNKSATFICEKTGCQMMKDPSLSDAPENSQTKKMNHQIIRDIFLT